MSSLSQNACAAIREHFTFAHTTSENAGRAGHNADSSETSHTSRVLSRRVALPSVILSLSFHPIFSVNISSFQQPALTLLILNLEGWLECMCEAFK